MKPSELIKVLQLAVDAGVDNTTQIFFDTEGQKFDYHMAEIDHANFEPDVLDKPFISLHEKRKLPKATIEYMNLWICPRCGGSTNTYRHPFAKVWCIECGYVLREEGDQTIQHKTEPDNDRKIHREKIVEKLSKRAERSITE